jgi:hypothetical protein
VSQAQGIQGQNSQAKAWSSQAGALGWEVKQAVQAGDLLSPGQSSQAAMRPHAPAFAPVVAQQGSDAAARHIQADTIQRHHIAAALKTGFRLGFRRGVQTLKTLKPLKP